MTDIKGTISQVVGPVVDVHFDLAGSGGQERLPRIHESLEIRRPGGRTLVVEVQQHIGEDTVRCIMLSPSEGLCKDMTVYPTGGAISVPVGEEVLGRLFNVLGETIDKKGPVETKEKWTIHREAPGFVDQSPVVEVL